MSEDMNTQVVRLGESLLNAELMNQNQMEFALQKQSVTGERLGELLVRLGIVSEYDLAKHLATQTEIEFIDVDVVPKPQADILRLFNQEYCLNRGFLPLYREGNELIVVIGNAKIQDVKQAISQRAGMNCVVKQGEFSKVLQAIRHNYFFIDNPVDKLFLKEVSRIDKDTDQVLSPESLIHYLLHLAVLERATDIHIQPEPKSIHISFRVDGVLQPVFAIPVSLKRLIAAIKRYAGMDISDQLRPQDGSFSTNILSMAFDVRVSTLISEYGENVVMRLLPSGMHVKGLNELGFFEEDLATLNNMFVHPHGILLMTGPTGSGKSTTLHAGLRSKGMVGKNILTVEDPIEYKLPTICQTQVNRKAGYDFSSAIRQFLRHDPDVMLVGEIRDPETAHAAVTAAETGHLVLSTLHVNSVLGVISRLQALDVPVQMIADSLVGVVNQRLARQVCSHCKTEYQPTDEEMTYFPKESGTISLFRGEGCAHCKGTGYFGRIPLYEILYVDAELQEMIASNSSRTELLRKLKASNFRSIEVMAIQQVLLGNTTLDEVIRLLGNSLERVLK
ncbi:GspE/PulE family protein [Thiomicrorhabdus lithotrophica]|uniref:ATPase, T2SS/T4P/T4SS family n=1 Tax=Thiomicrorhabdus lithotrophica TaxID=2949997 RepID=A0ABY8C949_9GAMM|nr:type II/IV secretion system protein [Thiomicrorhabdus lithotrophica]WEJ62501.1 ATPase, T2SS/T4P/T4SS family [Thiomicrorhabdus lithotrophica]